MKIAKFELTRALDKVKTIVTKNEQFPALQGVLVRDGWLTSSNMLITIQVKLEGSEGEEFILPMQSFALINSLPESEIEINSNDKDEITIKAERIKNKYQSWPADGFNFYKGEDLDKEGLPVPQNSVCVEGGRFIESLSHVAFAAADKNANQMMTGIYLESCEDVLKLTALDGHILANDKITAIGSDAEMKVIVPKTAANIIMKMGIIDDIEIVYGKNTIEFKSEGYRIISRVIDGDYFRYDSMISKSDNKAIISRKALIEAVSRSKLCVEETKPVVFKLEEDVLDISDGRGNYTETIGLIEPIGKPITIGFNPKLMLEAVKAFPSDEIIMNFVSPKHPMVIDADGVDIRVLVLPVKLRE